MGVLGTGKTLRFIAGNKLYEAPITPTMLPDGMFLSNQQPIQVMSKEEFELAAAKCEKGVIGDWESARE